MSRSVSGGASSGRTANSGLPAPIVVPTINANDRIVMLAEWSRPHADEVEPGTVVATVESSKSAAEIEAPAGGRLHWAVPSGARVATGTVIGWIVGLSAAIPPVPRLGEDAGRPCTDSARRLIAELGLDMRGVPGEGLITEAMIRQLAGAPDSGVGTAAETPSDGPSEPAMRGVCPPAKPARAAPVPAFMSRSVAKGPVDAFLDARTGSAVTATDIFLKAQGIALQEFTAWKRGSGGDRIALAITTEAGLIAPAIDDPAARTLDEIARWRIAAMRHVAVGAGAVEARPPTFAFTNLAGQDIEVFVPNLFGGLSATLGLGLRKADQPEWTLCLSFDHNVSDGFYAARFLGSLAELITNPEQLDLA